MYMESHPRQLIFLRKSDIIIHSLTHAFYLDAFPVRPDIPVCELVYEADQTRHYSIQPVLCGTTTPVYNNNNNNKHTST